jgi:hypothetical protein
VGALFSPRRRSPLKHRRFITRARELQFAGWFEHADTASVPPTCIGSYFPLRKRRTNLSHVEPVSETYTQDPLAKAYRYRKVAIEFSNLAKRTSSDFSRAYFECWQTANWGCGRQMQSCREGSLRLFHRNIFILLCFQTGLSSRVQVFS